MNFIWFLIRLFLADFVAVIVMSIGFVIVALPLYPMPLLQNRIPRILYYVLTYILSIPMLLFMLVFWGFWAAYCVGLTYRFINAPDVTLNWLYWITSFIVCGTLLSWMAYKEKQASLKELIIERRDVTDPVDQFDLEYQHFKEVKNIDRSTFMWIIYTYAIYLLFAFYPNLMIAIYGPALNILGVIS